MTGAAPDPAGYVMCIALHFKKKSECRNTFGIKSFGLGTVGPLIVWDCGHAYCVGLCQATPGVVDHTECGGFNRVPAGRCCIKEY
jgi:hypothetical protein